MRDILEWGDLGHLYAFDSWMANIDRHAGNLLFGGKNEIWLIDHGYCFSGPTWQPGDLDPNGEYRNRLSEWLTPHLTIDQKSRRSSEAVEFAASVCSIDVPESSRKSRIDTLMPAADMSALEAFLRIGLPTSLPTRTEHWECRCCYERATIRFRRPFPRFAECSRALGPGAARTDRWILRTTRHQALPSSARTVSISNSRMRSIG